MCAIEIRRSVLRTDFGDIFNAGECPILEVIQGYAKGYRQSKGTNLGTLERKSWEIKTVGMTLGAISLNLNRETCQD